MSFSDVVGYQHFGGPYCPIFSVKLHSEDHELNIHCCKDLKTCIM